jgi:hypothetical protein
MEVEVHGLGDDRVGTAGEQAQLERRDGVGQQLMFAHKLCVDEAV